MDLEQRKEAMAEQIIKAKAKVVRAYGKDIGRRWLEATPEDSYNNEAHRTTLFVLEGSGPKGFVLAHYSRGQVKAFGLEMNLLYTYRIRGY